MAETSLWAYLKKGMKGRWRHARRHEDLLGAGIADVSYYHFGNGWMELKEVKKLPARPTTGINLGQWHENEGAQRHFLKMRDGWLLVRVNYPLRVYLLYRHDILPPWEKPLWNWEQMEDNAYYFWQNRIDFEMLDNLLGMD